MTLKDPVVCIDENSKQLTRETHTPIPGNPVCYDTEYERNGIGAAFSAGGINIYYLEKKLEI